MSFAWDGLSPVSNLGYQVTRKQLCRKVHGSHSSQHFGHASAMPFGAEVWCRWEPLPALPQPALTLTAGRVQLWVLAHFPDPVGSLSRTA